MLTRIDISRDGAQWTVTTRCRAENDGATRGGYETLKAAVERAADLGGLSHEEIEQTIAQAHHDGGISRTCPGNLLTQTTGPSMEVDAQGSVLIRDFGHAPMRASTIEGAVEVAIERGWESRERAQAAIAELKELQRKVVTRERVRTL